MVQGNRFQVSPWELIPNVTAGILQPHERLLWVHSLGEWSPPSVSGGTFFLGWITLSLLVLVIWGRWNQRVRWCLGVGVFFFVLPIIIMLPWTTWADAVGLPDRVTGLFTLFRSPTRLFNISVFFGALGLGFFRGWEKRIGLVLLALMVVELLPSPVWHVRELPERETLRQVRHKVPTEAIVPFPFSKGGHAAHYGQTEHHLKFPIGPSTYLDTDLRDFLHGNPVFRALLRKKPPPDHGWEEVKELGYSGFILHSFPPPDHSGVPFKPPIYQGILGWQRIRDDWRKSLQQRFGPPVMENQFFELYRFNPRVSRGRGTK